MPFLRAVPPPEPDAPSTGEAGADPASLGPSSAALDLARAAAAGDARATRLLLQMLAPRMIRAVHALMGRLHPDADDVVQQALIGLIQALPAFRGECSPGHYAERIAARTAVTQRRRARTRSDRHEPEVDPDGLVATSGAPSEEAASARRRIVVRALLDELPEEQAEALALRIALGWSLKDVAEATGAPVNTVRSRLRLAKQSLRKRIESDPALLEELEVEG